MKRETLEQFLNRTEYVWRGMGPGGGFETAQSLERKVNPDGTLRPFFGDTVIFDLDDADKAWLFRLQQELYDACGYALAQPLAPDSFHLTLHDLTADADRESAALRMAKTRPAAKAALNALRACGDQEIAMRSTAALNMVGTSVVMAFEPASAADWATLQDLYACFEQAAELPYPLTPHVTLAYFRPGCYDAWTRDALNAFFSRSAQSRRALRLHTQKLYYCVFESMAHYDAV